MDKHCWKVNLDVFLGTVGRFLKSTTAPQGLELGYRTSKQVNKNKVNLVFRKAEKGYFLYIQKQQETFISAPFTTEKRRRYNIFNTPYFHQTQKKNNFGNVIFFMFL